MQIFTQQELRTGGVKGTATLILLIIWEEENPEYLVLYIERQSF